MRTLLLLVASIPVGLAGCDAAAPDALTGCWEGRLGDEHTLYRFFPDGHTTALRDLRRGAVYWGSYRLEGSRLTVDFGEEPPTFTIELTATTLRLVDLATTYARVDCAGIVE